MNELPFKEKFPELNEIQIKMLTKEVLDLVGPDLEHSHFTREYDRGCEDRDLINSHKRAIKNRLTSYFTSKTSITIEEKGLSIT